MEVSKVENKKVVELAQNKRKWLSEIALYIGVIAIILVFTLLCKVRGIDYLSWNNITNIVVQSSIVGVMAIGASIVILTGGIDLSSGSMLGFNGMICALLIVKGGLPLGIALVLTVVAGCLVGAVTGIGISYGKLPAFIMTLGIMEMAEGGALALNGGQPISGLPGELNAFAKLTILGIPTFVYCLIILYIIMIFVMGKTKFGRHVYALGGNVQAARLSGINTKMVEILVYTLAGLFSAIAALMLLARLAYASPTSGKGYEMDAIASCVIGGIALSGGQGKLRNTLVGALLLTILKNGLQMLDVSVYYQQIITGLVIVGAVLVDKSEERKAE
ncbi:ABC transporter permease [Lachnospiraceae bacterium KGMB03038]|nr:ABC transporter permease [Lachnospiraceae bacterium KGMB03038]